MRESDRGLFERRGSRGQIARRIGSLVCHVDRLARRPTDVAGTWAGMWCALEAAKHNSALHPTVHEELSFPTSNKNNTGGMFHFGNY